MTLEEKLALKDKELQDKIKTGEVKVCDTENIEGCENCGS